MSDTPPPGSFCKECQILPRPPYKPSIFEQGDYVRLRKDSKASPYVYTIVDTLRNIETGQWFVMLADQQGKVYWSESSYNWILESEVVWEKVKITKDATKEPRESGKALKAVETEEFGDKQTLIDFLNGESSE